VGTSVASLPGNGAIILTRPDPPINFANVPSITLKDRIGLSWQMAALQGGTPVLDYRISWTSDTSNPYSVLASDLKVLAYTALNLTAGTTYTFVIQARNAFEYSFYST
jgi:hypothetical protein